MNQDNEVPPCTVHLLPCHIQLSKYKGKLDPFDNTPFLVENASQENVFRSQFRGRELFGKAFDISKYHAEGVVFDVAQDHIRVVEAPVRYM